ncbi:hypothetical protein SAMN02745823_02425 [Sporobacter termitidis DSM 10068]|uniref:Uncharacterized protein n=1 Tax=Sporobacter termitidis DSM 10068 TaxID=1123282 RepID=A0A1M5YDU8_9FIRM|nr:hypothetical protein [Sporobacter termitidis]SHI10240.1 hypothetical protein SAMN02745823_02425 [Sporobacter termitidis DSM 10068]
MDRFKRAIFPMLIFFIIVVVLVYRLSSCTASSTLSGGAALPSSTASPAAPSPTPASSSGPAGNYTNDGITAFYKGAGFDVQDIRDAGGATVVRYGAPGADGRALSSFAWFDRATGARDVVAAGVSVDKYEITPDKKLTILTTGKDDQSGSQWFPELCTSAFNDAAEALRYLNGTSPYFMPLAQSFTLGTDSPASLKSITLDVDAVTVSFAPRPGREHGSMPRATVASGNGCCYVTFYGTALSSGFKAPKAGSGDQLRSFVSVKYDGANTVLTLKLGPETDRYNVSAGFSPDDGMPYAVLKFRSNDAIYPAYPAGW